MEKDKIIKEEFIVYGLGDTYKPELWHDPKNRELPWNKPFPRTGLWASPVNSRWGWKDWCISEDFRVESLDTSFKFKLKPESRILIIDNFTDLDNLCNYELLLEKSGLYGLDFEKISKNYDAMFLSEIGQEDTRMTMPKNLYGWDCECILILNKNIIIPVLAGIFFTPISLYVMYNLIFII